MHRRVSTLLAVVALVTVALVPASGVAVAQEGVPTDEPPNDPLPGDSQNNETESVAAVIDNDTRVLDYEYQDGAFAFTIESDAKRKVLTLLSLERSRGSGAGEASIKRVVLTEGKNTVEFRAPQDDPTVFFSTRESVENQRIAYVRVRTGIQLFSGPARWTFVWLAGGLGLLGGTGTVLWYAREFIREDDPQFVERVL